MAEQWVEWWVRYQVRRSRQDEQVSGKKWAWTESPALDEDNARSFADDLTKKTIGNVRRAQVVRKTCEVVS